MSTDVVEAEALFAARRLVYSALQQRGDPVLVEDVCLPRGWLAEVLMRVEEIAVRHDTFIANAAHAGERQPAPAAHRATGRRGGPRDGRRPRSPRSSKSRSTWAAPSPASTASASSTRARWSGNPADNDSSVASGSA